MVNILLEGYDIDAPWLYDELKKYIKPNHNVAVVAFSFRDSRVKSLSDWGALYGKEIGKYYNGIVGGLTAYGISESNISFVNYFTDTKETAARKIERADIVYFTGGLPDRMMERIKEFGLYDVLMKHDGIVMGYSAGALIQLAEYHLSPDDDYPEFKYCEGLPYLDGFYLEVHYEGAAVQKESVRRVLAERGKTVYATEFKSGAVLADSGNIKLLGDVKVFMKPVKEAGNLKMNIVGGRVLGQMSNVDVDASSAHKTNVEFWDTIGSEFLGATALPSWGGFLPNEDKLNLLGDLTNKTVLEIGCGNGRSLEYVANHKAIDLWGLDISSNQITRTKDYLESKGIHANLVCSPMEDECGLPTDFFDLVYSVYGIGWTTDLNKTFKRVFSYLKKGGIFVFGWSHPIHKCVSVENGQLIFRNSYFNEEWYRADMGDKEIMLSNRMMSTYINTLADNGFIIEKLIEETDRDTAIEADNDFGRKALMLPTAFVIKARKI